MTDATTPLDDVRSHRGPRRWPRLLLILAGYVAAGVAAHAFHDRLNDLTLAAYAVAEVGGAAFIVRFWRTDWRLHPWGRHVMAFMICMELIFTLSLSRRAFGTWPGLDEALFLCSVTFAGIVWWRYRLLVQGSRPASTGQISAPRD